jgi:hypothetical protein
MSYAELQVTTHFSFLRGASSADELFQTAKELGIDAIGVVDRNSLAGIVRALEASRANGVRLVVGCRIDLQDGMSVLVYPTDRAAYSRLTRLITLGKSRGAKNNCILHWDDVVSYSEGMIGILVPDLPDDVCATQLRKMAGLFHRSPSGAVVSSHPIVVLRRNLAKQAGSEQLRECRLLVASLPVAEHAFDLDDRFPSRVGRARSPNLRIPISRPPASHTVRSQPKGVIISIGRAGGWRILEGVQ